jgi:hypothetical protein
MEDGLGEEEARGSVLSPQKEELGLGGMRKHAFLSETTEKRIAGKYLKIFICV